MNDPLPQHICRKRRLLDAVDADGRTFAIESLH